MVWPQEANIFKDMKKLYLHATVVCDDDILDRFQMRSLETISVSRRNGRGPDISLKRLWIPSGSTCTKRRAVNNHPLPLALAKVYRI